MSSDRSRSVTPDGDHRVGPAQLPDAGPGPAPAGDGNDPAPNPNQIEIKVQTDGGNALFFKIKRTTKMSKVMEAWSAKEGKAPDSLRYFFDGQRLNVNDTPGDVSY